VDDYRRFVSEIRRVLRPGGIAIISTPNDLEYEEGNHFHLHEFEREELLALIKETFPYVDEYYQATWRYVALDSLDGLAKNSTRPTVNLAPLAPEQMRYFYFLCGDQPITSAVTPMGAVGEHYSERENIALHLELGSLRSELAALRQSRSFRLAHRMAGIASVFRR
jgi:SAM-dependent methyltransferase